MWDRGFFFFFFFKFFLYKKFGWKCFCIDLFLEMRLHVPKDCGVFCIFSLDEMKARQ